jgi:hypothetical protein
VHIRASDYSRQLNRHRWPPLDALSKLIEVVDPDVLDYGPKLVIHLCNERWNVTEYGMEAFGVENNQCVLPGDPIDVGAERDDGLIQGVEGVARRDQAKHLACAIEHGGGCDLGTEKGDRVVIELRNTMSQTWGWRGRLPGL